MARIERTRLCVTCGSLMDVQSCATGVIYTCAICDKRDPMERMRRWVASELRPPSR